MNVSSPQLLHIATECVNRLMFNAALSVFIIDLPSSFFLVLQNIANNVRLRTIHLYFTTESSLEKKDKGMWRKPYPLNRLLEEPHDLAGAEAVGQLLG